MSKAPNTSSGTGKTSGGASKGGSSSSPKTSQSKSDPIASNANHMPVIQARKGQSGEYATKGKWGTWADGQEAFKG